MFGGHRVTRNRLFAAALLAGLVFAHLAGSVVVSSWEYSFESFGLIWTLAAGQCALLGWWVGVTRTRLAWKVAGWCVGSALLLALFSRQFMIDPMNIWRNADSWPRMAWSLYFDLVPTVGGAVAIAAPLTTVLCLTGAWGLRLQGIRLSTPFGKGDGGTAKMNGRRWQFSLADLLLVTFTACTTLGLLALTAPYPAWILELPVACFKELSDGATATWYVLFVLDYVVVTFLAAEATLPKPLLSRRLGWVAVAGALWPLSHLLAMRTYMVFGAGLSPSQAGLEPAALISEGLPGYYQDFLRTFVLLAGTFLVVRLAGCRLVRAESGVPAEQTLVERGGK